MPLAKAISLGYHDIVDAGSAPETARRAAASHYSLTREQFREHLEAMAGLGCVASTVTDPSSCLFLTFDDGGAGAATCAAEELERHGWRGHFFITTDWIGKPGFLNAAEIRDLHRRGHIIGSHTRSHPSRMSHLGWDELLAEWTESCATLSDLLNKNIATASVSDGYYSRKVGQAAAAAGLQFLFNSEPTQSVAQVDGCCILGRYAILSNTPSSEAAALAAGEWKSGLRQATSWQARKLAKTVAGEHYLTLRRWLLSGSRQQY
jgi:peptidoglycan/xylan/chitin deacetylase (PgdA/CDA1 family)